VDERKDVLTESGRAKIAAEPTKAPAPVSGSAAVQQSVDQSQLRSANVAPAAPTAAPKPGGTGTTTQVAAPVQSIGNKTFLWRNEVWTDTQFDPSKMTTKKIEFGSDAYFALVNNAEVARYLALGTRVIFVLDGVAYEITDTGVGATDASAIPAFPTPTTPIQGGSIESRATTPAVPAMPLPGVSGTLGCGSGLLVGVLAWMVWRKEAGRVRPG
jgi:hypothetical protein